MLEETGYRAEDWQSLGAFTVDSNRQGGTAHLFLAKQLMLVERKVDDDAEDLQLEMMKPDAFLKAVSNQDVATLATLSAVALALVHGLI